MSLLSILVVEDDEGLQSLLRRLLSQEGRQVTVVGSGQEAIRVAQEIPVHVLMTDLNLPDIDGLAVLERYPPNRFQGDRDCDDRLRLNRLCRQGHEGRCL